MRDIRNNKKTIYKENMYLTIEWLIKSKHINGWNSIVMLQNAYKFIFELKKINDR